MKEYKEVVGKAISARVFTDTIEDSAMQSIEEMCARDMLRGSKIRIMPDVHAGLGCTIGTTLIVNSEVDARYVGVDLGCGVSGYPLSVEIIDYTTLDNFIRNSIPCGQNVNTSPTSFHLLGDLIGKNEVDIERAELSLGTLGGGNHYLEISQGEVVGKWLTIHSGSRMLGKQIAEHYIKVANTSYTKDFREEIQKTVKNLKKKGFTVRYQRL